MVFTGDIKIREGNPYVRVSSEVASSIKSGWRRPMPVIIRVNGKPVTPWHINMMPTGDGDFYLYLHGDVREASNTGVGDTVEIEIEFDQDYKNGPQHPVPEWFTTALSTHAEAKENWDALPPSRQKEVLRYFSWLKSDEAKMLNLKKALHVLSGKAGRFMARDWKNGK